MQLSSVEGRRRHQAIQAMLEQRGYDAFVVLAPSNFLYVTNFPLDVDPWERPIAAIFPREGEPILIMHELSTISFSLTCRLETCWVRSAEFYVEHPSLNGRKYFVHEWDRLFAMVLERLGLERRNLAFDALQLIPPGVRERLPFATFTAEPDLLHRLRMVKSREELALMRACGEATDWAQGHFHDLLSDGEYLKDVCLETNRRLGHFLVERYPESQFRPMVEGSCGAVSASPHHAGAGSGMKLHRGDNVVNFIAVVMNGYFVENERTYFVGTADAAQREYFDVMLAAHQAALAMMVEGQRISDIDSAAQTVIERAGYGAHILHRSGHGMGIGGHEYPVDMSFNHDPLLAGMVISCEPAIYVEDVGGFRHSNSVAVGSTEPSLLTQSAINFEAMLVP